MSFEINLTIPGIKVYKRKEAEEIHEETNAEGNIRVPHPRGPNSGASSGAQSLHVCVYQAAQVILLSEL